MAGPPTQNFQPQGLVTTAPTAPMTDHTHPSSVAAPAPQLPYRVPQALDYTLYTPTPAQAPTSPPAHPGPHPHPTNANAKLTQNLHTEKTITVLSAGLLSLLVIIFSYVAVFSSSQIYSNTIAPLASSGVLIALSIICSIFLCTPGRTLAAMMALLPILFSIIGGSMIVLLNASSKALADGAFIGVDINAVLISAAVFGGLGLGATIGFLLFVDVGSGRRWRR